MELELSLGKALSNWGKKGCFSGAVRTLRRAV